VATARYNINKNLWEELIVYFPFIIIILTANGVLPGGSGTTIRHNTQITHQNQTKHSTLNYTNNKGHTTHNEYNENTLTTTTETCTNHNYTT
jgi:tRNA(Arg) A34 adenosine deaminase TadA